MQSMETTTYTTSHRWRTDEYGSGRELEITATATRLDANELAERELDPSKPWAIMLSGEEIQYGQGSAVLNVNGTDWDPDGAWQNDMRADEPTESDCQALANEVLTDYIAQREEADQW